MVKARDTTSIASIQAKPGILKNQKLIILICKLIEKERKKKDFFCNLLKKDKNSSKRQTKNVQNLYNLFLTLGVEEIPFHQYFGVM